MHCAFPAARILRALLKKGWPLIRDCYRCSRGQQTILLVVAPFKSTVEGSSPVYRARFLQLVASFIQIARAAQSTSMPKD